MEILKHLRKYVTEVIAHCMFTYMCYAFLSIFLSLHCSGLINRDSKEGDAPGSSAVPFEHYWGASVFITGDKPFLETDTHERRPPLYFAGLLAVLNVITLGFYGCEAPVGLSYFGLTKMSLLAKMFIYLLFILPFLFLAILFGIGYCQKEATRLNNVSFAFNKPQKLDYVICRRARPVPSFKYYA